MEELTQRGRRRVYRLLCYLAHSDDELAAEEEALLARFRRRLRIGRQQAAALEEEARNGEKLQLKASEAEGEAAIEALAAVMLADGVLHPEEAQRLKRIARAVDISEKQVATALRRAMRERNQGSSGT